MTTEEETTNQLAKVITTTDEKNLSEKLNNYCLEELEDLEWLVNSFFRVNSNEYEFYIIQDNEAQFWNDHFFTPFRAIEAKGAHYSINDAYIYKGTDGLFYSCNDLSDFYSDRDVKDLTHAIIRDLKGDTKEGTLNNINYFEISDDLQEVLLEILKN